MTTGEMRITALLVTALVVFALYRRVSAVGKLARLLWIVMLLAVGAVTIAAFARFDPHLAFTYPEGAFRLSGRFFVGMGSGLIIAVYDYLGYNTVAYMGDELRDPGRVMPRAILYSILGMMVIYLTMNVAVLGAVPWQEIARSESIGSVVLERAWGPGAARAFTALIVLTGFASLVAGLLGASRVPYNAAKDKLFFAAFGRLHPTLRFPHVALFVMAAVTAIGCFFTLTDVINVLTAVFVLVQSVAQIAALTILRRRQPTLARPYRMALYPLPGVVACVGWVYVYVSSGLWPILLSLGWIAAGVIAFMVWARVERTWPFGPREIRERFIEGDPS
jgi:amino acid transporter